MTISEVSEKYDISVDTLRYYERIGILRNINRKPNGLRDYTEENCKTIEFVKCMRSAGLSIEFLIEYINLYDKGDSTIQARKNLLLEQKKILQDQLNAMMKTMERLDYKISNYGKLLDCQKVALGGNKNEKHKAK